MEVLKHSRRRAFDEMVQVRPQPVGQRDVQVCGVLASFLLDALRAPLQDVQRSICWDLKAQQLVMLRQGHLMEEVEAPHAPALGLHSCSYSCIVLHFLSFTYLYNNNAYIRII